MEHIILPLPNQFEIFPFTTIFKACACQGRQQSQGPSHLALGGKMAIAMDQLKTAEPARARHAAPRHVFLVFC